MLGSCRESIMSSWYRRLGWLACGLAFVCVLSACSERKHREVRYHEEQREGEVQEVSPGEMIVE